MLHLGKISCVCRYVVGAVELVSSFTEKDVRVLVDNKLIIGQQCILMTEGQQHAGAALGGALSAGQGR